ncbi:MAG: trigger factor [Myxococcales bacterium]|jgi:trigger factor|nr:trigger factor [Myxococcales bacterium]
MQVSVEKLSPVVVEFSVEVPVERVKSEVARAYQSLQKNAHVRGYRPGKAPRDILIHLYGPRVHADVAQRLVDETLPVALSEKSVQPLSKPAIAPNELSPEASFVYRARFEVRPEVSEVKWEGLAVKRPKLDIPESAIDARIEELRREHSTLQAPEPERAAKDGDVVGVSFVLEIDGTAHPSGEQSITTELGRGETMKEIEQALSGASVGDTKEVSVDFPQNHPAQDLRGKKGTFKITVKEIKERVLPAVDDELAKDCGDYADLAALKGKLREELEKAAKQRQSEVVAEQLVEQLCSANPIPVPPTLVEQQAAMTERELTQQARRMGQRIDPNALRAGARADAEKKVRAGLLMAEIAKIKSVKVEEADIEKGYTELAAQTGKNVAKLKAEYRDPKKREMLIAMILEDKILDLLEGAAAVTEE